MRLIVLLFMCSLFVGCTTTEKKAKNWAYNHKDKLAEWCADCFPVKTSELIKGDTVTLIDSVLRVDSVRVQADCPDGTKVDCPPTRTVTKIVKTHSTDTIKVRDVAYERVIENKVREVTIKNDQLTKELDKMTKERNKWRKWFAFLSLAIGLGIVAKVYLK